MTAIDRLTDRVAAGCAGWQVVVRKLKFVPFLIFFPLCIICRYLLYSQDQHVSLGGSALDRNLDPKGQQKEFATYLSTLEGTLRSDVPITVVYTTEGERAQRTYTMLPRKPVNEEINIFYGVQFAVFLVSLNDCRSQSSDQIK